MRLKNNRNRGSLVLELAFAGIFFTVFAFLTADMCFALFCASFNDRACRDAARAAAQTANLSEAQKKVQAILKAHQSPALLGGPSLYAPVIYQDYGGSPPPNTSPFVTVATTTSVKLPFAPIKFIGGTEFAPSGSVSFNQRYTFPIIRLK